MPTIDTERDVLKLINTFRFLPSVQTNSSRF